MKYPIGIQSFEQIIEEVMFISIRQHWSMT